MPPPGLGRQDESLFPELTRDEIDYLSSKGIQKRFPKNSILISEGDESDSMFVLLTGKVKIYASDDYGKEVVINIQGPGELFGEIAMIGETPRSASVMAIEPVEVAFLPRAKFEACLIDRPELAVKFLGLLVERVRGLTDMTKNLALNDVYGRIAYTLNKLAEEEDDERIIRIRLTHQDIASMVGSSREMVSRIMKDLTTGGYIDSHEKHITLKKKLPDAW
ncbi:MAG TPA: Crp/Fnr family transcriptional regulator [Pyrodictiaceae archaeon]|nr:Crp/Fnr family transcriptional regulator [Pyrodictiaceae archaeon]HIP68042.1 Crp/Fnr family transcriptional regulator [Chromatiales bacterium]